MQLPTGNRNSRPEVLYEKGALKNFAKFTGKHVAKQIIELLGLNNNCTSMRRRICSKLTKETTERNNLMSLFDAISANFEQISPDF